MYGITMIFFVLYSLLHVACEFVEATESFEIIFNEDGKWSPKAIAEYRGDIPTMTEFTACHWEKLKYFGTRSNAIWAYCKTNASEDILPSCIQLYSKPSQATGYRSISYNIWISGMSNKQTIKIEIGLDSYRHRTWNHICWYFSRDKGINELYYNGKLVGRKRILNIPVIEGSSKSYDHSFIMGQEPDKIRGGFAEDQAFFGSISQLNIWNTSISSTKIMGMAACNNEDVGNVVAWKKDRLILRSVILKPINQITVFCQSNNRFLIFPQRHLLRSANDVCSTHGGSMVAPGSKIDNTLVRQILSRNPKTCSNNFLTEKKDGLGLWLGLKKVGSDWFRESGHSTHKC